MRFPSTVFEIFPESCRWSFGGEEVEGAFRGGLEEGRGRVGGVDLAGERRVGDDWFLLC